MIAREDVIAAAIAEHRARGGTFPTDAGELGASLADRLGLPHPSLTPCAERGRVFVFVRQQRWFTIDVAARFGGVIVCTRNAAGKRANRDLSWYASLRAKGVELVTWEWMLDPGFVWRPGLPGEISFAKSINARAVCINLEPASGPLKGTSRDWRGKHAEVRAYIGAARELCDQAGIELWVTSWALTKNAPTFPWRELIAPAHRCLPQPYEVHGRAGPAYVADVFRDWIEHGADRAQIVVGRGAHELDDDDRDHWRTPAQIAMHRSSTPPGFDEAWWTAGGRMPPEVVAAIVAP